MVQYVYHILPQNLKGTVLYPLNELPAIDPELYKFHAKKYEGREHLLEFNIPHIDVLWNDVLFFSAINPELIWQHLNSLGIKRNKIRYIKVPVTDLPEHKTTIYQYENIDVNVIKKAEQIVPLKHDEYQELIEIPEHSKSYFKKRAELGKNPFNFVGIPHVLYAGTLDTSNYVVIESQ